LHVVPPMLERPRAVRRVATVLGRAFDRHQALGLTGAAALALGGCAAGALPRQDPFGAAPVIRQLREAPAAALVLAYAGLALLVAAWLFLGRLVGRPGGPGGSTLLGTFALWAGPLAVAPPLFSRDVYSYAAQGWLVTNGVNPYWWGPAALPGALADDVAPVWQHTPAPYGPVFLVVARVVVDLGGGHPVVTALGMRLVALAGIALLVRYLPRLAAHCGVEPDAAVWLGLLNPLVLLHLVGGAHNDALLMGLVVAGLVIMLDRRPALGVAILAVAVLVKAPAAVALAFAVPIWAGMIAGRARMPRAAGRTALVAGATIVGVSWLAGLGYGWLEALDTPGQVRNWLSISTVLGAAVALVARSVGLAAETDAAVTVFRSAGGLAALVTCLLLLARTPRNGPVATLGLALVVVVALGPVVHPWYLLWGFVLIAAGTASVRIRAAVVVASVALSLVVMPRGGMVDVSAIVPAVLAAAAVVAAAVLVEAGSLAAAARGQPPARGGETGSDTISA
jgi:hypothetical protein